MPERYLNDRRLYRLSAEDFRAFVYALMWSVANRTDGIISDEDIGLIPNYPKDGMCGARLVAAGVWESHPDGYYIVDYEATQTSKDQLDHLDNIRRREREKKRRQRAAKSESPGTVPGTNEGTIQDRTRQGQDRPGTGQDAQVKYLPSAGEPQNDMQRAAMESWAG